MSVDENFISGGRVFVEVLRPTVCLVSDKTEYDVCISYCLDGSWYAMLMSCKPQHFRS